MSESMIVFIIFTIYLCGLLPIGFFIANHSKCDNCTEKESEFGSYQPPTNDLNDNDPPNDE